MSRHHHLSAAGAAPVRLVLEAATDEGMEVEQSSVRRRPRRGPAGSSGDALEIVLQGEGDSGLSVTFERGDRSFTTEERDLVERFVATIGHVRVSVPEPGEAGQAGDAGDAPERSGGVARLEARSPDELAVADYADVLERCFFRLDEMAAAPTGERLAEVVRICAESAGVRSYWVARISGHDLLTVARHYLLGEKEDVVPLRRLRADALAMDPRIPVALEGGSFAGPVGATVWRPYLLSRGLVTCVGAGGYDDDARQWIACLFDDGSRDVVPLRMLLSGAVQAALGVPVGRRG